VIQVNLADKPASLSRIVNWVLQLSRTVVRIVPRKQVAVPYFDLPPIPNEIQSILRGAQVSL